MMKEFSDGSAMWRKWRRTGMLRGSIYVGECVSSHPVGRPRKMWIYALKDCLIKEKSFGCQASKGNGAR